MSAAIRVQDLTKRFGGLTAVDRVTFEIVPGTINGLIGPNGAGKTTVFNLVSRVLDPSEGTITVGGADVTSKSAAEVAGLGVARTFQTPRGFETLSVVENVQVMLRSPAESFFGGLFGGRGQERELREQSMATLERVGLSDRADDAYDNLSGGEHRLLEIARQLVRQPRVLLLDEPTAGVHPTLQAGLQSLLEQLHAEGVTILLVEHNLGFLMALAEHVHVMALGRLIASGAPAEISRNSLVIDAYLGRKGVDHAESA